tara:strand:+ start:506 stop:859 length:354 start_codon:yes stop_codon:yes gene_type:complete
MYRYKRKSNKFGARKTKFMGYTFDSMWEAERWGELSAMQRAGVVKDLERQVRYNLVINDQKICAYVADFQYKLIDENGFEKEIVEDAKGVETAEFKLKKKMMKAILGIDVIISKKRH